MKVVLADVERSALDATTQALSSQGAEVIGVECDVSKAQSVDAVATAALDAFGAVHVVCNNAGVLSTVAGPSWEHPLDDWAWVLGVNLMGVVHGIRSFVPILLEQGDGGHIMNTASMAGLLHNGGSYGVSKHAVVALSESLFGNSRNLVPRSVFRSCVRVGSILVSSNLNGIVPRHPAKWPVSRVRKSRRCRRS